ncbi:DUF3718 domain-containing protein [Paraglaciecola polaris]|nr:DUF3718 domain-containing protein [Paraglaciecola polaris]|tara:strand:- start:2994 stop:3308 length:315 start_codon:yes stop_codon:yes gene_type:complete
MRNTIIASILAVSGFCAGSANAEYMDPALENKLVKICHAIKSDSRVKLYMAIKNSGLRASNVAKGLVCNGYDPVTFAALNNANNTGLVMAKRLNVDYQELLAKL